MKIVKKNTLPLLIVACLAAVTAIVSFHGCSVTSYDMRLVSITVSPASPSIATGATQQFVATGKYSDDSTKDLSNQVTWSSSDPTAATIDPASGLATAQNVASTKSTVITATEAGGISGSSTLTVVNLPLVQINVTPATASIAKGTTQQFTATGVYSDGTTTLQQDLSSQATWTSNDASVTVSASGLATTTTGSVTVTITASKTPQGGGTDVTGTATLTVHDVTLSSIAVTPATVTLGRNATQQFTATGTFSDSSTQDITNLVAWSTDNTAIATIISPGRAKVTSTATKGGSTTVTATSGGSLAVQSGSATLNVSATGY